MKRLWTAPKRGHTSAENEDAADGVGSILAVADGATEAFASRIWAHLLVEQLTKSGQRAVPEDPAIWFWERIDAARAAWDAWRSTQELAWNEELAAQKGSAAAVAVLFLEPRARRVRGLAVGDVIAVRLRVAATPFVWPLTHSTEFTSRPVLIGSRRTAHREVAGFMDRYQCGDIWLLLTDALGAWALRCAEEGTPIWTDLVSLKTPEAWQQFVAAARAQGMKNDDTTLLVWEGRRSHRASAVKEQSDGYDHSTRH